MKKTLIFTIPLALILYLVMTYQPVSSSTGSFKYVGVNKCITCHKTEAQGKQYDIWKNSKHSQAWKTLQTPEADKVAKDKGFSTSAVETPECVKCHVLGKDIDPSELTEDFKKEDGVQCESCHGPGSEYKALSIMKDRQKAIENGLNVPSDIETFCKTCHNPESPSYKEFKFAEMWEKIKHEKPKN
ncbi:MAG: multiheme c-type cytochrome [Ignavibacteria bacterium]